MNECCLNVSIVQKKNKYVKVTYGHQTFTKESWASAQIQDVGYSSLYKIFQQILWTEIITQMQMFLWIYQ
jgi:hypothetical protein